MNNLSFFSHLFVYRLLWKMPWCCARSTTSGCSQPVNGWRMLYPSCSKLVWVWMWRTMKSVSGSRQTLWPQSRSSSPTWRSYRCCCPSWRTWSTPQLKTSSGWAWSRQSREVKRSEISSSVTRMSFTGTVVKIKELLCTCKASFSLSFCVAANRGISCFNIFCFS